MRYPISRLRDFLLEKLDRSPRTWNGIENKIYDFETSADKVISEWDTCLPVEARAAAALLESGLETRPLNALERAHVVLVAASVIEEEPFL